jgi:hypothetical protein
MKYQVAFDRQGNIQVVVPLPEATSVAGEPPRHHRTLVAGPDQQLATLTIPHDMVVTSPEDLIHRLRVDVTGKEPRLVSRAV